MGLSPAKSFPMIERSFPRNPKVEVPKLIQSTQQPLLTHPFPTDPSIEELQTCLGLIQRHHMTPSMQSHKRKIAATLHLSNLRPFLQRRRIISRERQIVQRDFAEGFLTRPFEGFGPSVVAEPIADEVRVAGVDEDGDLFEDAWDQAVERLHPVAGKEEISIDVEIAAVVAVGLDSQGFDNVGLVQVFGYPAQLLVAEAVAASAFVPNIVRVLTGPLVGADDGVVAVDACGDAGPDASGAVAAFDEGFAAGKGVIHGFAFAFVEDGGPAAIAAGHWAVVIVLCQAVGQTVAYKDGFEIDVALLEGKDLRGKDRNVVPSV